MKRFKLTILKPDGFRINGAIQAINANKAQSMICLPPGYTLENIEQISFARAFLLDREFASLVRL